MTSRINLEDDKKAKGCASAAYFVFSTKKSKYSKPALFMEKVLSGYLFWFVIIPGLTYLFLTGRALEFKSPGGWLMSLAIGLIIAAPSSIALLFFKGQEILRASQNEKLLLDVLLQYGIGVYASWLVAVIFFWMKRTNGWLTKKWLEIQNRFVENGTIITNWKPIEKLLLTCYAGNVCPYVKVKTEKEEIQGYCSRYYKEKPSFLLIAEDKENGRKVKILEEEVKSVELLTEKCIFKGGKKTDEKLEFLRMVHPDLPDMLR